MSGVVVVKPKREHHCNPGWEWRRPVDPEFDGATYGVPPDPYRFPRGTVWQCECGRTWVSLGSPAFNEPGRCTWRPEGRVARWRRERKARTALDPEQ